MWAMVFCNNLSYSVDHTFTRKRKGDLKVAMNLELLFIGERERIIVYERIT